MVYKKMLPIPKTMNGDYEYVGCFADTIERAIPTFRGKVTTVDECRVQAEAYSDDIFGVQAGNQCFTGK
jgi:hypothetical protein